MVDECCNIVYIKEEFFKEHFWFIEMLDPKDIKKQTQRGYLFLNIKYESNNIFIPLRSNLPNIRVLGEVGYPIPSKSKPNAGLDYRKLLIINTENYISNPKYCSIPGSQKKIIISDYEKIKKQLVKYISGYVKSVSKGRQNIDKKYCYSTLHNFHKELDIEKVDKREQIIHNEENTMKVFTNNSKNKKNEKEIISMVRNHEEWIESKGIRGIKLDFRNEDLRGMKFLNVDLRESNFQDADLRDCIIYADLRGANLTGINIDNTIFTGSNLNNIKIEKYKMNKIQDQINNSIEKHRIGLNNLQTVQREIAISKE
ncbi:MAG: pentapeptide repeat-containing protein [Cetobacterium sp.]|uniref:pentapeptide repeat-containing protein n=1 Tax=Bacteria TaxID=2 RepID=UPI002FC7DBD6